ncbi:DUF2189 domain-containing protein [Palleronia salina]|nr:DUF2189 domain-containing protein [Palleronia salina]
MPADSVTRPPALGRPDRALFAEALALAWSDFRAAPRFGLAVSGVYVVLGWLIAWITVASGTTYWLVLAAMGFPLIAPFAAVALYDVSRRMDLRQPLTWRAVLAETLAQRTGQLPVLGAAMVILFLFWFFLGHMIFALFLGLSPMTNVSTGLDVYLTANGLGMLAFGTLVGGVFALVLFSTSVMALPMLLDRDIDVITAMIASAGYVRRHPVPMLGWGLMIAGLTVLAIVPGFLGLLVVLPLLGHASWHLYALAVVRARQE